MKKKVFTLQEAQEIGRKLVENRSKELEKELKEIKNKNNTAKETNYV